MRWVLLGHGFMYALQLTIVPLTQNARTDWHDDVNDFWTQFALQAPFSVDSFLVIWFFSNIFNFKNV